MNQTSLDRLRDALKSSGPQAAIDELCTQLEAEKDFQSLFYALLLKKRHELGLSPIATGSNRDIPAPLQERFEEGIRQAARTVGGHFLADGNISAGFNYLNMIGELEPVRNALEAAQPPPDADMQPLIDIALHQGVHPRRGFDWIIERYGICNAITALSGDLPLAADVRADCVGKLIGALHDELGTRLKSDIAAHGETATEKSIAELIEGRDWLFSDDNYHVDLSHLNAVVQMSLNLENGPALRLARDLCAYGKKLPSRFGFSSDPPFDRQYEDFDIYLSVLTGEGVPRGLEHFWAKARAADPEEVGTFPAQVLVNLLLRIDRQNEALDAARQFLAQAGNDQLTCPSLVELCQRTGAYDVLAEVSREQDHAVNYLAGLIGTR